MASGNNGVGAGRPDSGVFLCDEVTPNNSDGSISQGGQWFKPIYLGCRPSSFPSAPPSSPFLGSSGPITQQILHPPPSVTRSRPGSLQEGGSEGSSGSQSPLLGRVGQWSAWSTGSAAERAEEYTDNAPQRRRFTCIAIALLAVVVAAFVLNACLGNGHSSGGSGSIVL